jgi:hypothetical protein
MKYHGVRLEMDPKEFGRCVFRNADAPTAFRCIVFTEGENPERSEQRTE